MLMDKFHSKLAPEKAARGEVLPGSGDDYKPEPKISEATIRAEKLGPYHERNNAGKPTYPAVSTVSIGGNGDPYLSRGKR